MRTRYDSYTEAFKDLSKLPETNFESLRPYTDIALLKTKSRFKIAWMSYRLCAYSHMYFEFEIERETHFKNVYLWFMKLSTALHRVVKPSMKFRNYAIPQTLTFEFPEIEWVLVGRLSEVLNMFFIMVFFQHPQKLIDRFCFPNHQESFFRDCGLGTYVENGVLNEKSSRTLLYVRYRKCIYNAMMELQHSKIRKLESQICGQNPDLCAFRYLHFQTLEITFSDETEVLKYMSSLLLVPQAQDRDAGYYKLSEYLSTTPGIEFPDISTIEYASTEVIGDPHLEYEMFYKHLHSINTTETQEVIRLFQMWPDLIKYQMLIVCPEIDACFGEAFSTEEELSVYWRRLRALLWLKSRKFFTSRDFKKCKPQEETKPSINSKISLFRKKL